MRVVPVVAAAVASLAVSAPSRAHADEARATVYVFFATWCVPCRVELPHVQRMHDRYKQRGVRVVLVSEDEPSTVKTVPSFLARYNVSVP